MSLMEKVKSFFSGGPDDAHDHSHDDGHDHAHDDAPVIEDPLAAPGMPVDPLGSTMPNTVPPPAPREGDET